MKKTIYFAAILACIGILAFAGGVAAQNTLVWFEQGGSTLTVESGGVINVKTGGEIQNNGTPLDLSSGIATATTASTAELNLIDGSIAGTAVASKAAVLGSNKNLDTLVIADGGLKLGSGAGTAIGATAAEINNAADVSARVQELTSSGAVTAGKQSVELNHATVAIAATIADAANHQGLFVCKDTSATGTESHTLTLTAGTFNGTNTVATFNARDESLFVYFDSAGRGQVIANIGSVALSGP